MTLMKAVNWMTATEMIKFYTLIMAWKTIYMGAPQHLATKLTLHPDNTITTSTPRLQNTSMGLRWRYCTNWNSMTPELRKNISLPRFKTNLKRWILDARNPTTKSK